MESIAVKNKILILNDIRSAQNVGSLFRTADAVGIEGIYLSSITAKPIDRFGRPVGAIAKTALGAEQNIPWQNFDDIKKLITDLKERGFYVVAIEQSENSIDYKKVSVKLPVAFILGNEVDGLKKEVLDLVDKTAEIPMQGSKESLNVSVACGVALFRMLDI